LWTAGEVALLGRSEELREDEEHFELAVRAFGGKRLAEQLIACIEDWRNAGSPRDDDLRLRLIPEGQPTRSAARISSQSGTLELTWRQPPA
jgi:hypothetical protein